MKKLPPGAHPDHLKKQAKALLRLYRQGDADAVARFVRFLPSAANRTHDEALALGLRLHDAQSCIAREYGFASWADLGAFVETHALAGQQRAQLIRRWLDLAYGGDVTGGFDAPRPRVAAQLLLDHPDLVAGDPTVACAAGDLDAVKAALAADPGWVARAGGALKLPPLVAVTHSRLGQLPEFAARLRACARLLLDAGADPNQRIGNRFPPASLAEPDEAGPLSALYGAAGVNRDPVLTAMLLEAGADPNDGESLYHSVENPACTRVLLEHGARVGGTNALRRTFDMHDADALELLLAHGGDPNEPPGPGLAQTWGAPLLRAIGVRCSARHVAALLAAGADPGARTPTGVSAYRLAMQAGLSDVAALLRAAGAEETLDAADAFVAACARADAGDARRIQARHPELPGALPDEQLRLLPDAAAWGSGDAVKVMVELGWPIAARGGDWDASALNHAVFRGDAGLLAFLLAHGVPHATRDPSNPDDVLIDGRKMRFSEAVTDVLLGIDGGPTASI